MTRSERATYSFISPLCTWEQSMLRYLPSDWPSIPYGGYGGFLLPILNCDQINPRIFLPSHRQGRTDAGRLTTSFTRYPIGIGITIIHIVALQPRQQLPASQLHNLASILVSTRSTSLIVLPDEAIQLLTLHKQQSPSRRDWHHPICIALSFLRSRKSCPDQQGSVQSQVLSFGCIGTLRTSRSQHCLLKVWLSILTRHKGQQGSRSISQSSRDSTIAERISPRSTYGCR